MASGGDGFKRKNKCFKTLDHVLRKIYECESGINLYWEI